jgi:hypothetical protein
MDVVNMIDKRHSARDNTPLLRTVTGACPGWLQEPASPEDPDQVAKPMIRADNDQGSLSGIYIRYESAFELVDHVFDAQLLLLKSSHS